MRPHFFALALVAIVSLAPLAPVASAQCPTGPLWQVTPAITRGGGSPNLGLTYVGRGSTLMAIWSETGSTPVPHIGGTAKWSWSPVSGATLNNFPSPVILTTDALHEYLFVTASDGFLYKVDASTGQQVGSKDTRRPTCSQDRMTATPAVQLYDLSNASFQSYANSSRGHPDDLVFVTTYNQCGDHAQNKVIACWASDLLTAWTFNATGSQSMDYGSEGCTIDYVRNTVYCGTEQTVAGQNTLWSISTTGGSLAWARDLVPFRARVEGAPQVSNVYVRGWDGGVRKHDANTGATIWVDPSPGFSVVSNVWAEFREPVDRNLIYCVDTDGKLRAIQDLGTVPVALFPPVAPPIGRFVTMPVRVGSKIYIGRDDGSVQQIDADSGVLEAAKAAGPPGAIGDPALDRSTPSGSVDRLIVATGTSAARFCVPWGSVVAVSENPPAPEGAGLLNNAPNPFRVGTAIEFRIATAAAVEVAIFGTDGARLRTLIREPLQAGRHAAAWDGRDDRGMMMPSGVYFCRLRVGEGTAARTEARKIQFVR